MAFKTKTISLLLSIKNVERANAFLKSVVDTAFCLEKIEVVASVLDGQAIISPHPKLLLRKVVGEVNSQCLHAAHGEIIILVSEDILIRSKDWDLHLREADQLFSDGVYLLHVKDGLKNEKFPTFPILSKRFCDLVQDPFPSEFSGAGTSAHLYDLFLRLQDLGHERIIYLPDIFFESLYCKQMGVNKTFYHLWRYRESQVARINSFLNGEELTKLTKDSFTRNTFSQIFACAKSSKQSLSYRMGYLANHIARELLSRFKTWINR